MISKILFGAALISLIIWAVGFWVYHSDSIIHLSLVFAAFFIALSFSTRIKDEDLK